MKKPKEDLKSLQKKWYKKLKDEGFEDIEANELTLKRNSTTRAFHSNMSSEWLEAKQTYYRMAEHFLNEYKFDNKTEHVIWDYHSNGVSARNITKLLKGVKLHNAYPMKVWRVVKKLRIKMYEMYMEPYGAYHE